MLHIIAHSYFIGIGVTVTFPDLETEERRRGGLCGSLTTAGAQSLPRGKLNVFCYFDFFLAFVRYTESEFLPLWCCQNDRTFL